MKGQFKPGDRVQVRDTDNRGWQRRVFMGYVKLEYPYLVMSENGQYAMSYAQCRHEVVDDAETARHAKIAELEHELEQLEQELAKLKNQ